MDKVEKIAADMKERMRFERDNLYRYGEMEKVIRLLTPFEKKFGEKGKELMDRVIRRLGSRYCCLEAKELYRKMFLEFGNASLSEEMKEIAHSGKSTFEGVKKELFARYRFLSDPLIEKIESERYGCNFAQDIESQIEDWSILLGRDFTLARTDLGENISDAQRQRHEEARRKALIFEKQKESDKPDYLIAPVNV